MNLSYALVPWIVLAVIIFWAVGAHNRLVRLRAAVPKAFAEVHTQFDGLVRMLTADANSDTEIDIDSPAAPTPGGAAKTTRAEGANANAGAAAVSVVAGAGVSPNRSAGGSRRRGKRRRASLSRIFPDASVMTDAQSLQDGSHALALSPTRVAGLGPTDVGVGLPISQPRSTTLRAAALQFAASLAAARARPLNRDVIGALGAARDVLVATWQGVVQGAHDACAPLPADVQLLWNAHLVQAAQSTRQFNAAVDRYNAASAQFPAATLAWLLRMRKASTL